MLLNKSFRSAPAALHRIAVSLILSLSILTNLFFDVPSLSADETARSENHRSMGVASCASSNCHGGVTPRKNSSVLQNEYITWLKKDKHAQAWKVLISPESKKIAWQLGIEDASKDASCLQCHASNPADSPGAKFRVEDGVGCESCHGAAEKWLPEHTASNATHQGNVAHGMVALEDSRVRAQKCLSCHQPDEANKFTHRLYGAGHPRLSFELDTYSIIQPAHWLNDQDYTERKGSYVPLRTWIAGQQVAAEHSVKLISRVSAGDESSLFPELSAYTCSSCHHTLSQRAFMTRDYRAHLGEPHLNLAPMRMISVALSAVKSPAFASLNKEILAIDSRAGRDTIAESTEEIRAILSDSETKAALDTVSDNPMAVLSSLLNYAIDNRSLYYETAEQIAMGAASAHAQITSGGVRPKELDDIFGTLHAPDSFNPELFSDTCAKYFKTLGK